MKKSRTETWKIVKSDGIWNAFPAAAARKFWRYADTKGTVKVRFRPISRGCGTVDTVNKLVARAVMDAFNAGRKSLAW